MWSKRSAFTILFNRLMPTLLTNYYFNKGIYLEFMNHYMIFGKSYIILTFELNSAGTIHNISIILPVFHIAKVFNTINIQTFNNSCLPGIFHRNNDSFESFLPCLQSDREYPFHQLQEYPWPEEDHKPILPSLCRPEPYLLLSAFLASDDSAH